MKKKKKKKKKKRGDREWVKRTRGGEIEGSACEEDGQLWRKRERISSWLD